MVLSGLVSCTLPRDLENRISYVISHDLQVSHLNSKPPAKDYYHVPTRFLRVHLRVSKLEEYQQCDGRRGTNVGCDPPINDRLCPAELQHDDVTRRTHFLRVRLAPIPVLVVLPNIPANVPSCETRSHSIVPNFSSLLPFLWCMGNKYIFLLAWPNRPS